MKDTAVQPAASFSAWRRLQRPLVHLGMIVLLGLVAYANTFHSPFHYDDYKNMLEVPYVQNLHYLTDLSQALKYAAGDHGFMMRFVGYLSFALNYALHGDAVEGYHVVNLAIHLVNASLVYFLVLFTLRTPFFAGQTVELQGVKAPTFLALFAALLFVCHPVQTQAVTYIVQRLASLATLFYLAAVLLYIKARLASDERGWKGRALAFYLAALLSAVLAMKTKEIAFTLPVSICLYEVLFFRDRLARRVLYLTPVLLALLVIPLSLLMLAGAGEALGDADSATKVGSDLSRSEYFFTELRVIVTYLRLLFLPVNQNLVYDYPVFVTPFTPPVFLSFLLLASLFALAIHCTLRSRCPEPGAGLLDGGASAARQQLRLIAFGIFWFFITLSVESSFIPITDVIFEHRLYLPSFGAFLAFASFFLWAVQQLAARSARAETAALALAALIILVLAAASYQRNQVWSSQESLWQDVVNKSPGKAVGYQYLGMALFERGEVERALANFDRSLALDPQLDGALINRGTLNARVGRYQLAIADFARVVELDPNSVEGWSNLGLSWSQLGDQEKAIAALKRALALNPNYVQALNNMGLALTRKGAPGEAIGYLGRALDLNRNYALAWFNRGVAHRGTGRLEPAISDLTRALELNPGFGAAYSRRGEALAQSGALDRALADFRAACQYGDQEGCQRLQALTGR